LNRFRIAVRPRTAKPLPTDDAQIRIEGLHSYTRARENVSEPRRLSPPRSGPCRPLTPSSGPWRVPDVGSWLRPTTRYCWGRPPHSHDDNPIHLPKSSLRRSKPTAGELYSTSDFEPVNGKKCENYPCGRRLSVSAR